MKKMKYILLTLLFTVVSVALQAQCPFDRSDCRGECGQFTDENKDGFCDFGLLTEKAQAQIKKDSKKETKTEQTTEQTVSKEETKKSPAQAREDLPPPATNGEFKPQMEKVEIVTVEDEDTASIAQEEPKQIKKKKPYDFLSISISTLLLYILTMVLVKTKKIKKITHRKIWNTILLVSFLVSGLLGLFLVVQLNYSVGLSLFHNFRFWHVETGIVMGIITIIHTFWHIEYYKKLFKKPANK